jgi:hypothetical protein
MNEMQWKHTDEEEYEDLKVNNRIQKESRSKKAELK